MADPDFLKSLAALSGPQQAGPPSLLLASAQPLPQASAKAAPTPQDDDANDDESADTPAPTQGPSPAPVAAAGPAASPAAQSTIGGLSLGDLQKALEQYQNQRRTAGMIGAVGDLLANRASAGAMYLGRDLPKNDVSGAIQANLPNPFANKLQLLTAYAQMRRAQGAMLPQELIKLNDDRVSKGLKPLAQSDVMGGGVDYSVDPTSAKGQQLNLDKNKFGFDQVKNQQEQVQQTLQALQSARGNPAVQQAEKDIYSNAKIQSLANQIGDLDNASPQQINLLAHETLKMASGGQGTEDELKGLKPGTPQYQLAELAQGLQNAPKGAKAGAFAKQLIDYANGMGSDARDLLKQNYQGIIETKKASLPPSAYNTLNKQFLDRLNGKVAPGDWIPGQSNGGGQTQDGGATKTWGGYNWKMIGSHWVKQGPSEQAGR